MPRPWQNLDPYAVRLIDRPELDAFDLIILRRVGPGQVAYMNRDGQWTDHGPALRLDLDEAACLTIPRDALANLRAELSNVLRDEPTMADVRGRLVATEEALAVERQRTDWTLEHLFAARAAGGGGAGAGT